MPSRTISIPPSVVIVLNPLYPSSVDDDLPDVFADRVRVHVSRDEMGERVAIKFMKKKCPF